MNNGSSQMLLLQPPQDQDYYLEVARQRQRRQQVQQAEEEDYEDYAVPADESCRLERSQVELVQMIGEGQRGYVFLGKLQSRDGARIQDVAVKTLRYETERLVERLMREANTLRQLEHPHIIRFIGVCPESPALIAMELAELGELKRYLRLNRQLLAGSHLLLFAFQISTALSYLESKQFVHRDVAARNVLVCSHTCVKLADFGLARNLQLAQQLYVSGSRGKLPVRWLAPESLAFRRFTSASDVWMFAVCAWEMFHFGSLRPWAGIRNNQVLLALESGQRLPRPPNCPGRLYQLMLRCWCYAPVQRPKFRDLKQLLWSIYLDERAREQLELERQLEAARQLELEQQRQLAMLRQRHTRLRFTPPSQSPLLASYSAGTNNSGYSSTTTTTTTTPATHSNNSSRSSSMGSLIKRQQQQQQVAALEAAAAAKTPKESLGGRVEANLRRFQRPPGQLLQKQRSQASILAPAEEPASTRDDQALYKSAQRRQSEHYNKSELRMAYVDSSSEDEAVDKLAARTEPAYEGLQAADKTQLLHLGAPQRNQLRCSTPLVVADLKESTARRLAADEEERKQLALHQRLLGNIRPSAGRQDRAARRSAHLAPPQQAVDQSLEILESLIGAKTFSNSRRQHEQGSPTSPSTTRPKAAIFNPAKR